MLDHQDLSAVREAANKAVQSALGADASALGADAAVQSAEHWGGGAHNSGFKLLLADGRQLFMKIEKEQIFPRSRRCQIEREVRGMELAAGAGLDVPAVLGCDFTHQTAGCRYLLEEFIDADLLGDALDKLPEEQRAALLAEFERRAEQVYTIRGDCFGDVHSGGWLGQYDSWREAVGALSALLLEDAAALGSYSAREQQRIADAHAFALDAIFYEGPAILTHNDLHPWNVFVDRSNGGTPSDGVPRVGKLFDFGLSLFQAEYLSCVGPDGFGGKEAEVARRYGVSERELRGYGVVSGLEFVNFASHIRFAPDQPYGCAARSKGYLAACEEYLQGR